jgi:hypothetical protein
LQSSANHRLIPTAGGFGRAPARQWNKLQQLAISTLPAHPALVSEADFIAAQAVSAVATPRDAPVGHYRLVGLLRCHHCGRRLESHWINGRPGYPCRHGRTSAQPASTTIKTIYVREDRILARFTTGFTAT